MSAADLSVSMLKKSLEANGLASYGTKEEMLQRLLAGGSKKKPGPKPKDGALPKKRKITSALKPPPATDSEEAAFMLSERPRLSSQGISDYAEQTAELKRRWAQVKKAKAKTSAPPTSTAPSSGSLVKSPVQLDSTQAASCGLTFVGTETLVDGSVQYIYMPASATDSSAAASAAPAKAKVGVKRKGIPTVAAMPADDEEADDDDDDDDDGDEMKWPIEVCIMRLLKKAKKEHMVALCGDFGVPVSGTKQELAGNLAEQLHYETDDDDDEEKEEEE